MAKTHADRNECLDEHDDEQGNDRVDDQVDGQVDDQVDEHFPEREGCDLVQHDIKRALLLQRPAKVNRHKTNPVRSRQGQQPS